MSFQHLTASDYRTMPWANGLGQTIEMLRREDSEGNLLLRLSMASVTEDGPFSLFPGIERNLTVLSGDGFELVEDDSGIVHQAALLTPLAFAGDITVTARQVTAPCQDFNVMTLRSGLSKPTVTVLHEASAITVNKGGELALFALLPATVQSAQWEFTLKAHELLVCQESVELLEGGLICVAL